MITLRITETYGDQSPFTLSSVEPKETWNLGQSLESFHGAPHSYSKRSKLTTTNSRPIWFYRWVLSWDKSSSGHEKNITHTIP